MITTEPGGAIAHEALVDVLTDVGARLDRMERVLDGLDRRVAALDELYEDLLPMANGMFAVASGKLEQLERDGALGFGREALVLLETVATSFSADDVRLLGQNVVGILETVRGLTQPEVRETLDRAAGALRDADSRQPEKLRLFKALRDPEIRRGMGVMLSVLREMGSDQERGSQANNGSAAGRTARVEGDDR